jgi:hypothetical protein
MTLGNSLNLTTLSRFHRKNAAAPIGLIDMACRNESGMRYTRTQGVDNSDFLDRNQSRPLLICDVSVLASGL